MIERDAHLRSGGSGERFARATRLCRFVDELDPEVAGRLAVTGDPSSEGAVFVEGQRICWAAARRMSGRLTQLLCDSERVGREHLEALFEECRRDSSPLGEELVRRGLVSPDALRDALLRHTTESLARLCDGGMFADWLERSGGGYNPRFTFTTTEVLFRLGALDHPEAAAAARAMLAGAFATPGDWGAAFVRCERAAGPVAVAATPHAPARASAILRAGTWALSAVDVARTFDEGGPAVWIPAAAGAERSWVAYLEGDLVIVGEVTKDGPARILHRRAKARASRS